MAYVWWPCGRRVAVVHEFRWSPANGGVATGDDVREIERKGLGTRQSFTTSRCAQTAGGEDGGGGVMRLAVETMF